MAPYQLFRTGLGILKENSSSLAFGFGIGMSIITLYEAIKAPSDPKKVLEDAELKKQEEKGEDTKLTNLEKGVVLTKTYSKVAVPYLFSLFGFGYSKSKDLNKIGTFGTMYALEKQHSKLIEEKATEILGEKKVEEIKEEVAKEQIKRNPPPEDEDLVGTTWFYDPLAASYFRMPINTFNEKVVDFNMSLMNEMYKSFNEFRQYYLGLPPLQVIGDGAGYNINVNGKMEVSIKHVVVDGIRVAFINYTNPPILGYMEA